ncbi:hypothetical protein TWF281_009314 [Arthrobotrys megalospora]
MTINGESLRFANSGDSGSFVYALLGDSDILLPVGVHISSDVGDEVSWFLPIGIILQELDKIHGIGATLCGEDCKYGVEYSESDDSDDDDEGSGESDAGGRERERGDEWRGGYSDGGRKEKAHEGEREKEEEEIKDKGDKRKQEKEGEGAERGRGEGQKGVVGELGGGGQPQGDEVGRTRSREIDRAAAPTEDQGQSGHEVQSEDQPIPGPSKKSGFDKTIKYLKDPREGTKKIASKVRGAIGSIFK